jgi:hypothetical protein
MKSAGWCSDGRLGRTLDVKGMDKQGELMRIEPSLWTNAAAIYEATYAPDAILIFPEVGRIGLEHALEAIRAENAARRHWAEVGFAGLSVTRIASDVELLTHEARRVGTTRRIRGGRFAQHCTRGAAIRGACYSTSRPASEREATIMDKRKSGRVFALSWIPFPNVPYQVYPR